MGAKHAIIIGIEKYMDEDIVPVKYAAADARGFSEALDYHGFAKDDQLLLLDGDATKSRMEYQIRQLMKGVGQDDVLYVFYAGHGLAVDDCNYITCYDSLYGNIAETGVKVQALFEEFRKSTCKHIVLFLDCGHEGLGVDDTAREILSDFRDDELRDFLDSAEYCACFSACKSDEKSHWHDELKHGLWAHGLIEALSGYGSDALAHDTLITSASLQDYLSSQVPITWRNVFNTRCAQTPWFYGDHSRQFPIGDVGPILTRRIAERETSPELKQMLFVREYGGSIKSLSGFQKKFHQVPDSLSQAADSFVESISSAEVLEDIETVFKAIKGQMAYTRRKITVSDVASGGASIITPDFEYSVNISQDRDVPSEYVIARSVSNLEKIDIVSHEGFQGVFGDMFDTLVFEPTASIDVGDFIDRIEENQPPGISIVDYPSDASWCEIAVDGFEGSIRVERMSFELRNPRCLPPARMLECFSRVHPQLAGTQTPRELPPATN
jgi:hypothetical protein